jgi:hypothetical protein
VLAYLRRHLTATATEVARACLPAAPPDWINRIVAELDWLGYVTVFPGPDGEPHALQLTDKGKAHAARAVPAWP